MVGLGRRVSVGDRRRTRRTRRGAPAEPKGGPAVTHLETPGLIVPTARAPQGNGMGLDDSVYQRLLRDRIIFLGSVVEDQVANAICAQLLLLAAEDPHKDIYLYVNSPGSSVSSGMAIYDTMQSVQ